MAEDKFHILSPDELVECPYEKTHMIRQKRMVYHLMKCRTNHPGNDYGTCPFNARHEVRRQELRFHIANCPDRVRIETDIVYEAQLNNDVLKGCTDVPSYNNVPVAPSSEDWDAESAEAGDRYTHRPQLRKHDVHHLQQRQLEKYYLTSKKKASPMVVDTTPTTMPTTISARLNPIYAMSMAGAGRGCTLDNPSATPPHGRWREERCEWGACTRAECEIGRQIELGKMTAQEIMAAMGRGRGIVSNQNSRSVSSRVGRAANTPTSPTNGFTPIHIPHEQMVTSPRVGELADYDQRTPTEGSAKRGSTASSDDLEMQHLRNQLRQISDLETRMILGERLSTEEMARIKRKGDVQKHIQLLECDL